MFVSTGSSGKRASFEETLRTPIPEEGHLWVPETLPIVSWPDASRPFWEFVSAAISPLIGADCSVPCRNALHEFPIALEQETRSIAALQLHRGPTLSFKDVGCSVAAELHRTFLPDKKNTRVIVATSGDTGSAAAHAFENICVLYPEGRVSHFQEQQMLQCEHATCLAIPEDFDACQRIAKRILREQRALSCNSVSLARLLPQIGMYAWAAAQRPHHIYFVPSGNYGNAVACLMAKRMGAPIESVHMACNANGTALVRFLNGQDYVPSTTIQTPATAMDVGTPSNAVRLFHCMQSGNPRDVIASVVSSANISTMADKTVCPHTACALHAAVRLGAPGSIIVRTADVKKFTYPRSSNARSPLVLHKPHALQKTCSTVLLVGMPGMGKTTLSFMLGGYDSDCTMIADRGKRNLPEVIASFDTTDAFIEYEGQTVIRMLDAVNTGDNTAVIATGGSAVHSAPLREYLTDNDNVLVVWLNREKVTVTDWSARGVVTPAHTPVTSPQQLEHLRNPLYAALADLELRTDLWDAQRSALALQSILRFFNE